MWLQSKSSQLQETRYVYVVNGSCFVKENILAQFQLNLVSGKAPRICTVPYRVTVPGLFLAKRLISVRHSLLPVPADIRPPLHPRHTLMICHAFLQNHCQKCEQHF